MDFETIAKKYGATSTTTPVQPTVDFSNIASKYGASVSTVPNNQPPIDEGAITVGGVKVVGGELGKNLQQFGQGFSQIRQGVENTNLPFSERLQTVGRGVLNEASGGIGAVFSPITTLFNTITGNKYSELTQQLQKDLENGQNTGLAGDVVKALSNSPAFQKLATENPNAGEVFSNLVNIGTAFIGGKEGPQAIKVGTEKLVKTASDFGTTLGELRPTVEQIANERQAKFAQGLESQNTRLKSVGNSFNENTIVRPTDKLDTAGNPIKETITPIDTFAKYNIAPVVEKGTIVMGDYKLGTGELGKIKEQVSRLDSEIDTKLVNNGTKIDLETFKNTVIDQVKNNPEFKRNGTVSSNLKKVDSRFEDYKNSYGDTIDIAEINNIRKTANKDYSPETQDISRTVGNITRDIVYNALPDKEIRNLLRQQSELLTAKNYAETINGTKVQGGKLGNYALRTIGAMIGSTIDKLPGAGTLIGAIGGEYASRALQQSQFRSAWTELRSLIQRSNNTQQTIKANTTPKIEIINKSIPKNKGFSNIGVITSIAGISGVIGALNIPRKITFLNDEGKKETVKLDGSVKEGEFTSYNPVEGQTDSTPNIMASGKKVYDGAIATGDRSIPFGTKVYVPELDRVFIVEDRMNKRYTPDQNNGKQFFDIVTATGTQKDVQNSKNFGRQKLHFIILNK